MLGSSGTSSQQKMMRISYPLANEGNTQEMESASNKQSITSSSRRHLSQRRFSPAGQNTAIWWPVNVVIVCLVVVLALITPAVEANVIPCDRFSALVNAVNDTKKFLYDDHPFVYDSFKLARYQSFEAASVNIHIPNLPLMADVPINMRLDANANLPLSLYLQHMFQYQIAFTQMASDEQAIGGEHNFASQFSQTSARHLAEITRTLGDYMDFHGVARNTEELDSPMFDDTFTRSTTSGRSLYVLEVFRHYIVMVFDGVVRLDNVVHTHVN